MKKLNLDIASEYLIMASELLEYTEYLGVTSGIQAQLPILLAEYNFYSKEDIDTYLELLKLIELEFLLILIYMAYS